MMDSVSLTGDTRPPEINSQDAERRRSAHAAGWRCVVAVAMQRIQRASSFTGNLITLEDDPEAQMHNDSLSKHQFE